MKIKGLQFRSLNQQTWNLDGKWIWDITWTNLIQLGIQLGIINWTIVVSVIQWLVYFQLTMVTRIRFPDFYVNLEKIKSENTATLNWLDELIWTFSINLHGALLPSRASGSQPSLHRNLEQLFSLIDEIETGSGRPWT